MGSAQAGGRQPFPTQACGAERVSAEILPTLCPASSREERPGAGPGLRGGGGQAAGCCVGLRKQLRSESSSGRRRRLFPSPSVFLGRGGGGARREKGARLTSGLSGACVGGGSFPKQLPPQPPRGPPISGEGCSMLASPTRPPLGAGGGRLPRGFSGIPPGDCPIPVQEPQKLRDCLSLEGHRGTGYQAPSPKYCSGADMQTSPLPWGPGNLRGSCGRDRAGAPPPGGTLQGLGQALALLWPLGSPSWSLGQGWVERAPPLTGATPWVLPCLPTPPQLGQSPPVVLLRVVGHLRPQREGAPGPLVSLRGPS